MPSSLGSPSFWRLPSVGWLVFSFMLITSLAPLRCSGAKEGKVAPLLAKLDELLGLTNDTVHIKTLPREVQDTCLTISKARTTATPKKLDEDLVKFLRGRKIAIAYFGLTKSLSSTICNIYVRVYRPLEEAGLQIDSYLHTYDLKMLKGSGRNPEERDKAQLLNHHDHRLLPLKAFSVTNQTEYLATIDIQDYVPKRGKRKFADGEHVVWNLIAQYNSLDLVTSLWTESGEEYDAVLYLRPDMAWVGDFPVDVLRETLQTRDKKEAKREVYVAASWMQARGVNDRLGIGTPGAMEHFGRRVKNARDHSARQSIRAEQFLGYHMKYRNVGVNATRELIVYLPIMHVPVLRVRHSCANVAEFQHTFGEGWKKGDTILRKGCMVAHQDCQAFPFLEGLPEEDIFLPRLDTDEENRKELPKGEPHRSLCVSSVGLCKELTWEMRERYVLSPYTERDLMMWAQGKGWGDRIWKTRSFRNGTKIERKVPSVGSGFRLVYNVTERR